MYRYSIVISYYEDARILKLLDGCPKMREDIEIIVVDDCSRKLKASSILGAKFGKSFVKVVVMDQNR